MSSQDLQKLSNCIRMLSATMVEKANSGHPGMPLGVADVLTVLFSKFLNFDAKNPKWSARDRFILSAGHGSAALYSLFYLLGYDDVSIEDLKNFRQIGSKTAGHPEYGHVAGVEVTTGPLGQGIANGVGFAIAEELSFARGFTKQRNKTYVLCGDGCLMEGVSYEALALAGHLGLQNFVLIYDKNDITIDGSLSLSDSTDVRLRFESIGFNVFSCDGHDFEQIQNAIQSATLSNGRPSVVIAKTKIGFASKVEGSSKSHGSPLGLDGLLALKETLKWKDDDFVIPNDLLAVWRSFSKKSDLSDVQKEFPFQEAILHLAEYKQKAIELKEKKATRQHFQSLISHLIAKMPEYFIGGSADLSGSNGTQGNGAKIISKTDFSGNYINYGVREHGMAAIMNGIFLYGWFLPFGGTFLVFSDYMRPSIRLSALMGLPVVYVLTHDSIAVGEDGPTHQPVEHIDSLRLIPNLNVFRPCDAVEMCECFEVALKNPKIPSAMILTRQAIPFMRDESYSSECKTSYGAYYIYKKENSQINIFASGSEVSLAFKVAYLLKESGFVSSVISIPCLDLFELQDAEYKKQFFKPETKNVLIELSSGTVFLKYGKVDLTISINSFGTSGKQDDVLNLFGFVEEKIIQKIKSVL